MIPKRSLGIILAVITVAITLANQETVGIARDEQVYMHNGMRYSDWWAGALQGKGLSKAGITSTFGGPEATDNNREHPPLMKTLFGMSHRILHVWLGVDEITAFRFPSALMHGVLVLLVFGMAFALWGFAEAILACLLVMFLPRALFHAGLACFDAPIMTLWFATIYGYWRALDGRKWPWLVGVVFGLALATKHNALLLPFALGIHYMIAGYRNAGFAGIVTYRWRVIVSLGVIAPLTLLLVWPWLWLDPYNHVKSWLDFHLEHSHYNFEYLGQNWNAPPFPWHTALVTTAFTVPAGTLVAAAIGAIVWFVRRREVGEPTRMPGLLLVLSAVASIGPFLLGSTPIFGAEKHWMPALPSLCIAGGLGTVWAARSLAALIPPGGSANQWIRRSIAGTACTLVVVAALVETLAAQPYALTWYNAIAGGAPGGADLGMNRQFWGVSAPGVFEALQREGKPKPEKSLYWHDASPAAGFYLKHDRVPPNMGHSGQEDYGVRSSKLALVIHELHFNRHDYMIWREYGTVQPMFVLRSDGVPIISVYKRPIPKLKPP